ncbi:hypothetical protein BTVI_139472 [Pitangus sulphuratus]|nr:hypothetical protein BTVI_139472 [Pitangus sulphuratus]
MVSLWLLVLHAPAPCLGRAPPAGGSPFPDGRQEEGLLQCEGLKFESGIAEVFCSLPIYKEMGQLRMPLLSIEGLFPAMGLWNLECFLGQFVKTLPEYHVVDPARVDASGHFLSFNLHHHISNTRKKRDLGKNENVVYYKISHEEKDLFFNLTVHVGFLSHNYVVERRRGNHTSAKIATHSGAPCHFLGTAWQPGFESGTAAISTCNGLGYETTQLSHKGRIYNLTFTEEYNDNIFHVTQVTCVVLSRTLCRSGVAIQWALLNIDQYQLKLELMLSRKFEVNYLSV